MPTDSQRNSIILASASPRRAELLAMVGQDFEVMVSHADETMCPFISVEEQTMACAAAKAHAVAERVDDGDKRPIVACDTIVLVDREVLGKPHDADDARRMLKLLSGRSHQVISGVCILARGIERRFYESTDVRFRELSDAEIEDYVLSGEPLDKAGSYGIQGKASLFVQGIHGDYFNVVGLPLCHLMQELESLEEAGQ